MTRISEEDLEFSHISDESEMLDPSDDGKKHRGREYTPGKAHGGRGRRALIIAGRILLTLLVTVVLLCGGIYGLMCVLVYGPSKTAQEQFVLSLRETSAIGFIANWFFTEEEVQDIITRNSIKDSDAVTDTNLIVLQKPSDASDNLAQEQPDIEILDVKGATYRGKMMIVKDPSRVFVGTVPEFFEGDGKVVAKLAEQYGAIGGINGGEFVDGDLTYTAQPVGLVMTDGRIVNGDTTTRCHVTGLTYDNILVVGNMNGQQALDMGMRDCVSISSHIGPFLIINGEAQDVSGVGGGLNPRTAIGQRSDGSILLLVVDGRMVNSPGATFADLLGIMQKYEAVNASVMDGGTSTQMYYDGQVVNTPYSPLGPRRCPTAFLVR